jgi:Zn-dependent metalloprotease
VKILSRGRSFALGLALVAAGLAAPPALSASAAPAAKPDPNLVSKMRSAAAGSVALRANPATGDVGFARATGANPDLLPGVRAEDRQGAIDKATTYLRRYAPVFGARADELKQSGVYADQTGYSVTFSQSYRGVPVFGAELKAHVDKQGDLTSVNGYAAPHLSLSTTPRVSESDASSRALTMVRAQPAGYEDGGPADYKKGLTVRDIKLMVYRTGSTRGIDGEAKLAWVAEVWNQNNIREMVILDATTGKYLNRWSMMTDDLDRTLVEANGSDDPSTFTEVWHEGDPFPDGLDQDQQNEVLGTAEAYWMFRNTFGRDSYDGKGHPMTTVNNDGRIDCPNANWNGTTTNYCNGVSSDDTVAHEWAHAYTEYTSGLIYQWQPGAMNEAYSDIWGETVDMLNNRFNDKGESQADPIKRTPGTCSNYTRSPIDVEITAPAEIAGDCQAAPASFGPVITQTPLTVLVVVGADADTDGPDNDPLVNDTTTNGCDPLDNAAEVAGKWVFVDRGFCTFAVKIANAEDAGAEGIVIGDNREEPPFSVAGESSLYGIMVDQASGTKIKSVPGPVTLKVNAQPADTDDTYRWLSGENDPAFGGAIRDMWNPNCYGDPGRVSDEEYVCDGADDHGGVHTNSGIVNRTYAILVDGYAPGNVTGIGLDKAANLFWHTQTNYLTPVSGFKDLADGLEASCADLTGAPIKKVTLGDPERADEADGQATAPPAAKIKAADCTQVANAVKVTQLRKNPVQCNFQPMLEKGSVSCGKKFKTKTVWKENFEDGLKGWTKDAEFFVNDDPPTTTDDPSGDYPGGHVSHPWKTTSKLPPVTDLPGGAGTHAKSRVAFGADPTTGSCAFDADDESSRDGLISPTVTVPKGFQPRLSFAHYVATEQGFDGGNVKISINGDDFEMIPADAWVLNGPGATLASVSAGNTDPMAGEAAFTGTDGGQVTGSWGTSVVNLARAGAKAGDVVQFRFDMGRDGCNGVDGWYVDDIAVQVCKEVSRKAARLTTDE